MALGGKGILASKRGLAALVPLAKGQAPHIPWEREIDVQLKWTAKNLGTHKFQHEVKNLVRADTLQVLQETSGEALVNVSFLDRRPHGTASHERVAQPKSHAPHVVVETGMLPSARFADTKLLVPWLLPLRTMLPGESILITIFCKVDTHFACILRGVQYQ
jgi:hypothetical protein